MSEKKYQFKTNINCSGCVAAVKPFLDKAEGIQSWEVDTTIPDKILTVVTEKLSEDDVKQIIEKAGYKVKE
jgi:copper chaperone